MKRLLLRGVVACALAVGATGLWAQDHPQDRPQDQRSAENRTYMDSNHRRHEWNADEDSAWNRYRDEHHIRQSEFGRLNRRQQNAYWKWRGEHHDDRQHD